MKTRILFIGLCLFFTTSTFAQNNKVLFWTSPQGVLQASLDDLQPRELASVTLLGANEVAVDTLNQKVYWTSAFIGKVVRSNLDGTAIENLVTNGQESPMGISLDIAAGKMYWADPDLNTVKRANLDGTDEETLAQTPFGLEPVDTALDLINNKIYWVGENPRGDMFVRRSNLDGTEIEDVISPENSTVFISFPHYIEIDAENNKLYIGGRFRHYRANLDGTEQEEIIDNPDSVSGFALDLKRDKLYWIAPGGGSNKLKKANLDGSNIEEVFSFGNSTPLGLTIDANSGTMYWADWRTTEVLKANLDGTDIQSLFSPPEHSFPRVIDWHPVTHQLFWTDIGTERVVSLSTLDGVVDTVASKAAGLGPAGSSQVPHGVAIDYTKNELYWTAPGGNTIDYSIQRSNLDGSDIVDVLTEDDGLGSAWDLKLDLSTRYIYWTQRFAGGIERASMDGGPIEQLDIEPEAHAVGLAIDSIGQKIYWTQDKGFEMKIIRADMDGTNREDLVTEGLSDPVGIALDLENGKMYWADWRLNKIRRANLDGTDVEDVLSTYQPLWISIGVSPSTTSTPKHSAPSSFTLDTYPNPFTTHTNLEYTLDAPQHVHIAVYDALGREVALLTDAQHPAGTHQLTWNSETLPAGIYFIRVQSRYEAATRAVVKSE